MKALVIGGTGPTGPHIIRGLMQRGYAVTMLNRGSRDSTAIPSEVERVIGDPHFPDTLETALSGRTFDVVVATYGRIRYVTEVMSNKTDRLITVGGPPSYRGFGNPDAVFPPGMAVPTREDAERVESSAESQFGYLIRTTEDAVLDAQASGHMVVSHFRYPTVYGPWQVRPTTLWWIMQRCLDGRPVCVLPEGGLTLITRGYSENMAHAVLLSLDNTDAASGQIYNCGDDDQFTLAQWVAIIAQAMNCSLPVVSVPDAHASPSRDLMQFRGTSHHQSLDLEKARRELGYADVVPALDAIRRTVKWFQDNPPTDPDYLAQIRQHYPVEDRLIELAAKSSEAMATLSHVEEEFHHSYAHPRQRGMVRDHRDR
ncbi:MAG: NAD-dependent epimerase/dehydratase family protein [Pseudomonadota bacterium]